MTAGSRQGSVRGSVRGLAQLFRVTEKPIRMNEMRDKESLLPLPDASLAAMLRAARLAACGLTFSLALGLVLTNTAALAADDDDDDVGIEQKLIDKLMSGIQGRSMNNSGIDYRERSPLVIPPSLNLPPPAAEQVSAPNWPKDPEIKKRKLEREAKRKARIERQMDGSGQFPQVLKPDQLDGNVPRRAATGASAAIDPNEGPKKPSQLGYFGGIFSNLTGKSDESAPFTGEPERSSLSDPPPGYQTPSPTYSYGLGAGARQQQATEANPADGPLKPGKF